MDLNRIARNVFLTAMDVETAPRVVTRQNLMLRSALATLKIFFGNEQDVREGMAKIKTLMSQGQTGIETEGMTPEQVETIAEDMAGKVWTKFNNSIPDDIKVRVPVMRSAIAEIMKALFGVEKFRKSVFAMLERKMGVDVEQLGYEGKAKKDLFKGMYMTLRNAIRSALPSEVKKVASEARHQQTVR